MPNNSIHNSQYSNNLTLVNKNDLPSKIPIAEITEAGNDVTVFVELFVVDGNNGTLEYIMKVFNDRSDAGEKLAPLLAPYADTNAIILAIPRGGVVVGQMIARTLRIPLDIVVTRKIGAPDNEEYAIGAIDIDGTGTFNEKEVVAVDKKWLEETIAKEKKDAQRRITLYRGTREPLELKGKTVIIVDDGIATGLTIKAAIQYVKKVGAEKVVVASPVASKDTAEELAHITETKILTVSPLFSAVGQFYKDFPQISDEEVVSILNETR